MTVAGAGSGAGAGAEAGADKNTCVNTNLALFVVFGLIHGTCGFLKEEILYQLQPKTRLTQLLWQSLIN